MQKEPQKFEYGIKRSICAGLALFFLAGCAGADKTTKTTTTKTTVTYPAAEGNRGYLRSATTVTSNDQQASSVTQQSETTTTATETKAGHPSILGSTLHAIGWVIALPFRLVGGLLGWIF